jgi:hypothetical protein
MTEDIELMRGSGHVYRDLGRPKGDLEMARAAVAVKIIRVLGSLISPLGKLDETVEINLSFKSKPAAAQPATNVF